MKRLKRPMALLLLLVVVLICPLSAAAASPDDDQVVKEFTNSVTIEWVWDDGGGTNPGGGGGGGGGGNGGSNIPPPRGFTIPDGGTPAGTVTILDPEVPLADLGELPKTGGDLLIPLLLCGVGALLVMAGRSPGKQAQPAATV